MKGPDDDRITRGRRERMALALCILLATGCGRHDQPPSEAEGEAGTAVSPATTAPEAGAADTTSQAAGTPTHTEMINVDLRIAEGVTLRVRRLVGEAVSSRAGQPVGLDDKTSYEIQVQSAETWIGYPDLSRLMNEYTFNFKGAPVKHLEVTREEDAGEEDQIQLKGRLKKVLGVPFEIEGRPEVTQDGRIRIRTTSIQALDVKVGGLMHALGLEPKDLLGNLEKRGLQVDGNDLILDPSRAFPPPRVAGRVTAVRVEPNGLALSLGSPDTTSGDQPDKSNYLWFRKGTIRIGKMTQRDADLRIVDADPKDPLDFYGDKMTRQLVAGYAKLGAGGGLTIFVPDYAEIR